MVFYCEELRRGVWGSMSRFPAGWLAVWSDGVSAKLVNNIVATGQLRALLVALQGNDRQLQITAMVLRGRECR